MTSRWTRITFDPQVMGGKPCIRGMRVTVGMILGLMASGQTTLEILKAYPYLEEGDLREALDYAAWRSQEQDLPLPGVNLLLDMNLSPDWGDVLRARGWSVEHWSSVGDPRATDATIMAWARETRPAS